MIDIHCHILPDLDDGAEDIAESVAMARLARADGCEKVCATPHRLNGATDIAPALVNERLAQMRVALREAAIDLEVLPGADVHWHEQLLDNVHSDPSLLMDPKGRYLLLELPEGLVPANLKEVLFRLQTRGITPILSHPERHEILRERPDYIRSLVEAGVLLQITAGSLTGEFGPDAGRAARRLLRGGLVHFVASDAHSIGGRPPGLSGARDVLERLIGRQAAEDLLINNPRRMLSSEAIETTAVFEGRSHRRTGRRPRVLALLAKADWVTAATVSVMIVSASLAFGGVFPVSRMLLFLLAGVLAALWTARRLWDRQAGVRCRGLMALYLCVGVMAVVQMVARPLSDGPPGVLLSRSRQTLSLADTRMFLCWWVLVAVVWLGVASIRSGTSVRFVMVVLLLLASFQAVYGMLEQFSEHRHIFATPREHHLDSVTGTYVNRNHFGGLLAMIAPVTLGFAVSLSAPWDRRKDVSFRQKLGAWLAAPQTPKLVLVLFLLGVVSAGVILSLSRGALVAVLTGLSVTALMLSVRRRTRTHKRMALVALALLMLVGVGIASSALVDRLSPSHEVAVGSVWFRQIVWEDALRMLRHFPVLGVGAGAFDAVYPLYRSPELAGLHVRYAHNDYLQFLVENGLVGGAVLLTGVLVLLKRTTVAMRELSDPVTLAWAAGLIGGIGAIAAHSFFDFNLHIPANLITAVTLFGLLEALRLGGMIRRCQRA